MSHSTSSNVCFNPDCAESKSERPRNGWRLRTGEVVELCDRCCSAFEEGRYCDIFHINAAGWKCCESCGKRVHCGCVVSAHAFTLLDATGIECIACTRKNPMLASNHAWSPSLFNHAPLHERFKEISIKNWNHLAGSGPVPWRQAPSLFHSPISQPELHPRIPYEVDRLNAGDRLSAPSLEKRKVDDFSQRFRNGSLKLGPQDVPENGKAGAVGAASWVTAKSDIKHSTAGTNNEEQRSSSITLSHQSSSLRDDSSTPQFGLHLPCSSPKETNGPIGASGIHLQATPPPLLAKQFHGNLHNGVDSAGETQSRNGRPRADGRGRSQLLSRYWPRFTDQELLQISGNTNAIITPLFEKMLSASDAGRIGRLVLPKKCAEAYFPPISQPEGLPLKVQDSKGKEWIFQFRFWPNNNSRMYVLEGVTPCIQNMQLQAGDIVTFSRLEPEGKLVMGFRKASTVAPADQDSETNKTGNGVPMLGDVEFADPSTWSKVDKSGYIAKEALGAKSSIPRKRKSSTLGSKSKRLRIENEDLIELKLTWGEAQGLLRPPLNHSPSVVVIEGFEFEEYEDAPVLGRPTIFATNDAGEKVQWVQCEDCSKWRRLPGHAVLPSKWTCFDNADPERSSCSAAQELTTGQLEDLLRPCNLATSKKMKAAKQEPDNFEALEGLDTLANLAILGEGEEPPASSQATTKHPRHRPGCSCIVCIQPPSGKGPKHKQTCTCNVCQTVKRRFRTLMLRREKKQSEREAETTRKKQQESNLPMAEKSCDDDILPCNNTSSSSSEQKKVISDGSDDDPNKTKSSTSPFKGQIDLNIQPEREEELSPGSDSCSMMRLLQDATERYLRQRLSSSSGDKNSAGNQTPPGGGAEGTGEKASNSTTPDSHQEVDKDHSVPSSVKAPASAPSTG